jgi:hypothetical protein
MLALKQNQTTANTHIFSGGKTHTTLYEVIEAVAKVIGPGEERLIGAVVTQLLGDCCARLECDHPSGYADGKGGKQHLSLYRGAQA